MMMPIKSKHARNEKELWMKDPFRHYAYRRWAEEGEDAKKLFTF